jgi:prolyl 4-hydroxylase
MISEKYSKLLSGYTYLSNRASRNFAAALMPLGATAYQEDSSQINCLYFDTHQGKTPPEGVEINLQLMERKKTVPLDNKALLAKRLINQGICDPMVYFNVADVPRDQNTLWYVKDPLSTGGKSIQVVKYNELKNAFKTGHIIQAAIKDICVAESRKFTLRVYILVYRNQIYLYPDGIMVIHGLNYHPESTDYSVQVDHTGYADPGSTVEMRPFSSYHLYLPFMINIAETAPRIFQAFSDLLDGDSSRYCLFGLDYLCRKNRTVALVEINDRPNLLHTHAINQNINIEMIRDMVVLMTQKKWHDSHDYPQRFFWIGSLYE